MSVHRNGDAHGGQRAQMLQELELQMAVSCLMWALETEFRSSGREVSISLAPEMTLLSDMLAVPSKLKFLHRYTCISPRSSFKLLRAAQAAEQGEYSGSPRETPPSDWWVSSCGFTSHS